MKAVIIKRLEGLKHKLHNYDVELVSNASIKCLTELKEIRNKVKFNAYDEIDRIITEIKEA